MSQTQATPPAVIKLPPSRLPIIGSVADELGINAMQWRVLVDQVFPNAKSAEAIALALTYCKARNLDVFKRPVHIVPMWSSALNRMVETVWPGIAEVRTTAVRTGAYAGIDEVIYGPMAERKFSGVKEVWENNRKTGTEAVEITAQFPEFASVVVYRMVEGQKCAFNAKVYWEEAFASDKAGLPNTMWQKRPRGQLDKCVEAAALRKAFPEELGNTYVAEEMEGRTIDGSGVATADPIGLATITTAAPSRSGPPAAPKPAAKPAEVERKIDFSAHNNAPDADDFPGDRKPNAQAAGIEHKPSVPINIIEQAKAELAAVEDGDAQGFQSAWEPYKNAQSDVDDETWQALIDLGQRHFDRTSDRASFKPHAQADDDNSNDWDA